MDRLTLTVSLMAGGAFVLTWGLYRLEAVVRREDRAGLPWFETALCAAGIALLIVGCHVHLPPRPPVRPADASAGLPTSQPTTSVPSVSRRL